MVVETMPRLVPATRSASTSWSTSAAGTPGRCFSAVMNGNRLVSGTPLRNSVANTS